MLSVLALVDVDETCFTPSREGGQGTDHNSLFVAALGTDAPLQPLVPRHVKNNAEDVSSALHVLKQDGAVLLSNVVDPEAAVALRVCYDSKLLGGPTVHEAMGELAALNSSNAFYMAERKIEGLRIRRNGARGRYDLKSFDRRDGGALVRRLGLPDLFEPFLRIAEVHNLLSASIESSTGWRLMTAGTLTADAGAAVGGWHRDFADGLFADESLNLQLPDYFFTVLAPLDDVSAEQGTELVLGSHKLRTGELSGALTTGAARRVIAAARPGDVLVFNGKVVHRGMPNPTARSRTLVYLVYTAKWYQQGRDPTQEFYAG